MNFLFYINAVLDNFRDWWINGILIGLGDF